VGLGVVVRLQIGFKEDELGSYEQTEMSTTIITCIVYALEKLWGRKQA
jgi:CRISPR/Cas system CSM-associated protein Csm4 (group 5 of RAMP superfamily)